MAAHSILPCRSGPGANAGSFSFAGASPLMYTLATCNVHIATLVGVKRGNITAVLCSQSSSQTRVAVSLLRMHVCCHVALSCTDGRSMSPAFRVPVRVKFLCTGLTVKMGRQPPVAAEACFRGDMVPSVLCWPWCFPLLLPPPASADSDTLSRTVARTAALPPSLT